MKIVWSKMQRKVFQNRWRYQRRIKVKLAELDDRSAPRPDIKKISATENHFRLRVGDYRIMITLRDDPDNHCYVLAVKRRTSTTYLHEEKAPMAVQLIKDDNGKRSTSSFPMTNTFVCAYRWQKSTTKPMRIWRILKSNTIV
jgi:mRNA-degrading endonuclease RelE of RelBE toxin-antitoxin system